MSDAATPTAIYRGMDRAALDRAGIRVLPIVRYPFLVFYSVDEAAQEVLISAGTPRRPRSRSPFRLAHPPRSIPG